MTPDPDHRAVEALMRERGTPQINHGDGPDLIGGNPSCLAAADAIAALRGEVERVSGMWGRVNVQCAKLIHWREAIDRWFIGWHQVPDDTKDAWEQINAMICWEQKVALDPAVSEEARKLMQQPDQSEISALRGDLDEARDNIAEMKGNNKHLLHQLAALTAERDGLRARVERMDTARLQRMEAPSPRAHAESMLLRNAEIAEETWKDVEYP